MFKKIIHFLKYHNGAVFILLAVFFLGSAVFASEDIQSAIGSAQTKIEGFDNSLLVQADLENFNMEFTVEKVEKESGYYFVSFSFLDLVKEKEGWQYKLRRKVLKFKEKKNQAIEKIAGEELAEIRQARIRFLKSQQEKAKIAGQEGRSEFTEYSGLIGKTFDIISKIFPGFEPGEKKELPLAASLAGFKEIAAAAEEFDLNRNPEGLEIDLTEVYANYLIETGLVDSNATSTQTATSTEDAISEPGSSGDETESEPADSTGDPAEPEVEIIDLSEPPAENEEPQESQEPQAEPAQESPSVPDPPAEEVPAPDISPESSEE